MAPGKGQSPAFVTNSLPRQSVGVGGWQHSPVWSGSKRAFCFEMPVSRGNQMSKEWCSLWWSLFGSLSLGWWGPGSSRRTVLPLSGRLGPRGGPGRGPSHCQVCRLGTGSGGTKGLGFPQRRSQHPLGCQLSGTRVCFEPRNTPASAMEVSGFLFPQKSTTESKSCMPSRKSSRSFQRKTTKSSNTSSPT